MKKRSHRWAPPQTDPGIPTAAFCYTASGQDLLCPSFSIIAVKKKKRAIFQFDPIRSPAVKAKRTKNHSNSLTERSRNALMELVKREKPIQIVDLNRSKNRIFWVK